MFNPQAHIYVTVGFSIDDARQLEKIIKPLIDVYDDVDSLKTILDIAVQIQKLPSIIESHDAIKDHDDDDEEADENEYDGIQYPNTNLIQNWRMN